MATKMANSEEAVKRITESEEHFICTTYSYILVMSHHSAYAGFSSHANWNIGLCLGQTTSNSRNEPYLQFETQSLWGFWNSKPPKKNPKHPSHIPKKLPIVFQKTTETVYVKWKAGQPWYHGVVMLQQQLLQVSLRVFDMLNARPGEKSVCCAFFSAWWYGWGSTGWQSRQVGCLS